MYHRAVAAIAMAALSITTAGSQVSTADPDAEVEPVAAEARDGGVLPEESPKTSAAPAYDEGREAAWVREASDGQATGADSDAWREKVPGPPDDPAARPQHDGAIAFGGAPTVIAMGQFAEAPSSSGESVLGTISTHDLSPAGIGFAAPTHGIGDTAGFAGSSQLSAGFGCAVACIESGLAYARGFGAELVVQTSVPTTMFFGLIELGPGYPPVATTTINSMSTYHSWELDELDPAKSYGVTVVATDSDGNGDLGYGEFTTLSTRTVSVQIGDVTISGGPSVISDTQFWLGVADHGLVSVAPGQAGSPTHDVVPSHTDVRLVVRRFFDHIGGCTAVGGHDEYGYSDQGHSIDQCVVWNTARLDDVDLDVVPAGATRWSSTTFTRNLTTPSGAGEPTPAGFGDDWWLDVQTTATFHVSYS